MFELVKAVLCIALLFGIYVILVILFERYLGISLLFSTSHREAKKFNNKRRNTAVSVEKFSRENPEIFKQILIDIKKKRFAKIPENYDLLIRRYIKNNPTWADAEYEKATANYNRELSILKQKDKEAEIMEEQKHIEVLIAKGLSYEEAKEIYDDFRKQIPFRGVARLELFNQKPEKKIYN